MTTIYKNFADLLPKDRKKILTGSVIPRPIAWVSSLNDDGSVNLAPFSYFNMVSETTLMISFMEKTKHTLQNILREKEAVVHGVSLPYVKQMNATSKMLAVNESEVLDQGLTLIPSTQIKTPAIQEARIRFETQLLQHIELEDTDVILLKVIGAHLEADVYDKTTGYINTERYEPVSRLAGRDYGITQILKDYKREF